MQRLLNPITGLPETRLLFEYLPMWKAVLQPEDPETLAALAQPSFAGMSGLHAKGAAGGDDDDEEEDEDMDEDMALLLALDADNEDDDEDDDDEDMDGGEEEAKGGARDRKRRADDAGSDGAKTEDDDGVLTPAERVCRLAYDQLMAAVLQMLERLDLGVVPANNREGADDTMGVEAVAGTSQGVVLSSWPRSPVLLCGIVCVCVCVCVCGCLCGCVWLCGCAC